MARAAFVRRGFLLLGILAAGAVIAPAAPPTVLTLALDGPVSAACVPYLNAAASGAFAAAGLEVSISYPEGEGAAIAALTAGRVDACVADAVAVLAARAGGANVTIVASIGDLHPACVVSRPEAAISAPASLAGKRLAADPLDGDWLLFPLFLAGVGLRAEDVTVVLFDRSGVRAALAAGSVDGVLDRVDNAEPGFAVLPWAAHGFSRYGPCVAVRDDALRLRPSAVRSFLKVILRTWEACLQDPSAAARSAAASGRVRSDDAAAWLAAVRVRFDTDTYRKKGLGWIDRSRMTATLEAVRGVLGQPVNFPASEAFTTAYLPVPAVLRASAGAAGRAAEPAPLKR
jgi:NitT/TauT family transport system substrate-binding protein